MKTYGKGEVQLHVFLTSALLGVEWTDLRPERFTPPPRWNSPRYPFDARLGGVHSLSGFGDEKNPCSYRGSNPSRPSRGSVTELTQLKGVVAFMDRNEANYENLKHKNTSEG
jgi:hypothetical protein